MISPEAIVAKYGMKLLGILAIVGLLAYMHHSIYQDGYDDAKAKYEARDTKATAEALGILAESKRINDNQFDKDKLDYENRIKDLNVKLATVITDNTASVPIRTQRPQACREVKANDTKGTGGDLGEAGITELAEYNRGLLKQTEAQIDFMAKELLACSRKVREAYDVW